MGTFTGSHLGWLAVVGASGDGTILSTLLQPGVMRRVNPVRIVWVFIIFGVLQGGCLWGRWRELERGTDGGGIGCLDC